MIKKQSKNKHHKDKQHMETPALSLSLTEITQCIYVARGTQVMLDSDLADLYQIETKNLNKAAHRNSGRFPSDFRFQLDQQEYDSLRFQFGTLKAGRGEHRKYLPVVYTEQGVAMLSGILKTKRAVEVNVTVMRAFVQLRRSSANNDELKAELEKVKETLNELKYEIQAKVSSNAIQSINVVTFSATVTFPQSPALIPTTIQLPDHHDEQVINRAGTPSQTTKPALPF